MNIYICRNAILYFLELSYFIYIFKKKTIIYFIRFIRHCTQKCRLFSDDDKYLFLFLTRYKIAMNYFYEKTEH